MPLDLGAFNTQTESWSPDGAQYSDYSVAPITAGVPSTNVDTERSNGVSFTGILNGFTSSANTLADTFSKVYAINSAVENAKFSRVVSAATLDLQQARTLGGLDIQRATIDASVAIEKARAARAVGDAQAQIKSGGMGYIPRNAISPSIIFGGIALLGALIYFRGAKK